MLEKYVQDFDPNVFLQELAAEKQITKKNALEICRRAVPKESYYQKKIIERLKKQFPDAYVFKISQGAYSHGGIPDIACILGGHYFAFEVKRPVLGKVSRLQEAAIQKIRQAGGTADVITWEEEAVRCILKRIKMEDKNAEKINI